MNEFHTDDLIYYKNGEEIYSGGFHLNSLLLKQNNSPLNTLNTQEQHGGKKVSQLYENLAIPFGLYSQNDHSTYSLHSFSSELLPSFIESKVISSKKNKSKRIK